MSRQPQNGKSAGKTKDTITPRKPPDGRLAPLDYALSVMHDDTMPAALRANMAKAALPFLHSRTVPMLPTPTISGSRASQGVSSRNSAALPFAPRRWRGKLQTAAAQAQASEAESQRQAALARAAEESALIAEMRVRELESKTLAAQTHARALEDRALAAEAVIERMKETAQDVRHSAPASPPPALDAGARRQIEIAQEARRVAEERARKAEMRARDMEQRSLAAEEIIARSR